MKQLIGICYKSTFVVLLVFSLTTAARAQFGNHKTPAGGYTHRPPGDFGDGSGRLVTGMVSPMSQSANPQENLYESMKAQNVPSIIHVEDLTAEWHVITAEAPGYYSYRSDDLYYTAGNVFFFGGQKFLVAYHLLISSDPDQRAAQQYFSAQVGKDDSQRTIPLLLKNSQLALSLFALDQNSSFHEIIKFDPAKDIASAPPKFLIDRKDSESNLKQIGLAVFMYMQDYDEKMPPMVAARSAEHLMYLPSSKTTSVPTVQNLLQPYTHSTEIFLQPTTHRPYLPNYKVSRWPDSKFGNPSETFLFFEDAPGADGKRSVVFADGHVETMEENQFQWRRKAQGISESGYPSAAKPTQKAKATPKA